jgi:dTDP-4-amino-4,6-dideoxygalactose transaminase
MKKPLQGLIIENRSRRLSKKSIKYLVIIHQFGLMSDIDEIERIVKENSLIVIEDAACALGSTFNGRKAGSIGEVGIFSFHPRKSITTGEGGAIVTNNKILADLVAKNLQPGIFQTNYKNFVMCPGADKTCYFKKC